SPVASLGFTRWGSRRRTSPRTPMTDSGRRGRSPRVSPWNTSCTMPVRSRRSTNSTPPWSRTRATHPVKTTGLPACSRRSVPHSWVRWSKSACPGTVLPLSLENQRSNPARLGPLPGRGGSPLDGRGDFLEAGQGHFRFIPCGQVADDGPARRHFLLTQDENRPGRVAVGPAHLGLQAAAHVVHVHRQPFPPQAVHQGHGRGTGLG